VKLASRSSSTEAGITGHDIADARQRLDHANDQQHQEATAVSMNGRLCYADAGLIDLPAAVRSNTTPQLPATPAEPLALLQPDDMPARNSPESADTLFWLILLVCASSQRQ
jgi:hypothetical protein